MAFSPPIFGFNDPFDDTDIFEFVYSDPQYIEPSVIDDISTNVGSDLGVPALTLGLTPTQSIRSQNSPSQYFPEDLDFRFELDPSRLNEGQEGLGFMPEKKREVIRFPAYRREPSDSGSGATLDPTSTTVSGRYRHWSITPKFLVTSRLALSAYSRSYKTGEAQSPPRTETSQNSVDAEDQGVLLVPYP